MTSAYAPQPGSAGARAIQYLQGLGEGAEVSSAELAGALEVNVNAMSAFLNTVMSHKLMVRERRDNKAYWRLGPDAARLPAAALAAADPAPDPDDADLETDDAPITRVLTSASLQSIEGFPRQSWCPAAQAVGSESSLDEPSAPPPPSPAQPPLGLGWKAPTVPVYLGEPPAPLPSPRPPAAPEPGPAADALEDDPDFREVERAPRPPEPDTPPKGAEAAQAPVSLCGRDDATPNDGVVPQESQFRCALWSSGELHIELYPGNYLLLTKDETRRLVSYLDRMAEVAE